MKEILYTFFKISQYDLNSLHCKRNKQGKIDKTGGN